MERLSTLASANAKLERLHIRLTPLRHAVLEAVYALPARPSVDALVRHLRPRFPRANATTVRNCVHVFEKMGLLPEPNGDGSSQAG
jgi:Fur family peroxide stress response transcriptional regulator